MKEEEEEEEVEGDEVAPSPPKVAKTAAGTLGAILFFFRSGETLNQPAKRAQQLKQRGREREGRFKKIM